MKRSSWTDYQKDIADDNYYYARSCIRQNFFPGSEKVFLDILSKDLGRNIFDDPLHTSCTGIRRYQGNDQQRDYFHDEGRRGNNKPCP